MPLLVALIVPELNTGSRPPRRTMPTPLPLAVSVLPCR